MHTGSDDGFEIDPRGFLADPDEEVGEPAERVEEAAEPLLVEDQIDDGRDGRAGVAALEQIEEELTEVERAMERLDDGRYGVCDTCGSPIEDSRLAERPMERLCDLHRRPASGAGAP